MTQTPIRPVAFANLAERVQAGDRAAEAEVVSRFHRGVFALLVARIHDVEAARDLCQDVMLAVLRALRDGLVRSGESLAAFVRGTAVNLANKHICALAEARRRAPPPADPDPPDPEELVAFREKVARVQRAIRRLNGTDRTILVLTLRQGLNPAEIGERLGLKAEVVRERKSRAIRRISERVKRQSRRSGSGH